MSPAELEAWGKAAAAIATAVGAVVTALWAIFGPIGRRVKAWRDARRRRRELVDLAISAVGDLLDGHVLMLRDRLPLVGEWRPGEDELLYKLGQLLERREALYLAQGHRPTLPKPQQLALARPDGSVAARVEEVHRRTQRIRLAQERAAGRQDMFADKDLE